MFTIKLMMDSGPTPSKIRLIEAEGVTIYEYENGASQITVHQKAADDESDGRVFYVGQPPHAVPGAPYDHFDYAYIENAAGKTTQKVYQRPMTANALPGHGSVIRQ